MNDAPGISNDEKLYASYSRYCSPTYPEFLRRLGIDHGFLSAEGCLIVDSSGKEYLDCIGGFGINNCGHNNPAITQALSEQLLDMKSAARPFISEIQVNLARRLAEVSPGDLECSFLCNSGSEAIDTAIKLARLCRGKALILSATNSFHGYTFGALSASGIPRFSRPFAPLVGGMERIKFGDINSLKEKIGENTAAVILEPVQHEAGVNLPPAGYLREVREICDQTGTLLIIDEVKTGLGKTGTMFACEQEGIVPDLLVVGKSLGGGLVPIGAVIAKNKYWLRFGYSFAMSASSYAWNSLGCRAALATIDLVDSVGFLDSCRKNGAILLEGIRQLAKNNSSIISVTGGIGLLAGIKCRSAHIAFQLSKCMVAKNVLMFQAFADPETVMIEPPLVISLKQIESVIKKLNEVCELLQRQTENT